MNQKLELRTKGLAERSFTTHRSEDSKKRTVGQGPREVLSAYQVGRTDRHHQFLLSAYADCRPIRCHDPIPVDFALSSSGAMPACYRCESSRAQNIKPRDSETAPKRFQIMRLNASNFSTPSEWAETYANAIKSVRPSRTDQMLKCRAGREKTQGARMIN